MDIKERLKGMPDSAGVYLFKDGRGCILYIGKAANLRKRLRSYFYRKEDSSSKIAIMLSKAQVIDFKQCRSETEALILESELIKKMRPRYNTVGRDDKSFLWVRISKEDFSRVSVTRPRIRERGVLIGPFTSAYLLRSALKTIRIIFPFRTCSKMPKSVCLDYHMYLCPAPCIGKISKSRYSSNIKNLSNILHGRQKIIIKELSRKMHTLSAKQRFEEAAIFRDQIQGLQNLWQAGSSGGLRGLLWQVKSVLGLKRLPLRIEGFDISNISGNYNVGSLVSFYKLKPDKSQYRRYRVKSVSGSNDYESILEILKRRFSALKKDNLETPDLIVVDGGKGQVSAVGKALIAVGFDIPVIGIAKKKEHIFMPQRRAALILPSNSKVLHLIQYIRNEAHRFALKYHRLLRKKKIFKMKPKVMSSRNFGMT